MEMSVITAAHILLNGTQFHIAVSKFKEGLHMSYSCMPREQEDNNLVNN